MFTNISTFTTFICAHGVKLYSYVDVNETLFSDWVCTAVMSNDVMKDLRG